MYTFSGEETANLVYPPSEKGSTHESKFFLFRVDPFSEVTSSKGEQTGSIPCQSGGNELSLFSSFKNVSSNVFANISLYDHN